MKKLSLLSTLMVILFACNNNAETDSNAAATDTVTNIPTSENAFLQGSFPQLFSFYKNADPAFNANNFEAEQTTAIENAEAYKIDKQQLEPFYPYFVYNSDSSLAIDLYSYNYILTKRNDKIRADAGGPDAEVAVIDVKNGTRKRIFFSGPSVSLLEAKWLDNSTVFLAGVEVGEDDKNKPIVLKADLAKNNIQWYIHNAFINADVSDYVEERVINKLN